MNDECQYCLGMDSAIEKLKTEIDEYQDKLELSQPVYSRREMENKLKNRDQEISRLKAEVHELKHGKHHKYCDQWIKEREEMIKELIDTFDLFDEVPLPFKILNKMESVVKKAREVLKELGVEI